MDEFDIYLESTGSMNIYNGNTMASFRNLLVHPIHLEGDWRVALAEIIFPTRVKNITTSDFFIYTPETPYSSSGLSSSENTSGLIKREDWSDNAVFPDGEIRSIWPILITLKAGSKSKQPLLSAKEDDGNNVELTFKDGYGISVRDRTLFDVLGFNGVPDPNRGGFFLGNNSLVKKMSQPIVNDYPSDITAGTNMFFLNTNIIEHQHVAGVKSPLLRIIENTRKISDGKLQVNSTTSHKTFTDLQFKKLITSTIEEIQIELVTVTGHKVPFVGTGRVAITLKFRKF